MDTKQTLLKGIYGITSERLLTMPKNRILHQIEQACSAGLTLLQYRHKNTPVLKKTTLLEIKKICHAYHCLFIINDNLELATQLQADGVHLGQTDGSIQQARQQCGKDFIIGASCYNSLKKAIQAQQQGASYVAFGAMFASPSKPEAPLANINTLEQARELLDIAICCIGGINHNNINQLKGKSDLYAVISAVFNQANTYLAVKALAAATN